MITTGVLFCLIDKRMLFIDTESGTKITDKTQTASKK